MQLYEMRLTALTMATRALIQANGGMVHSVAQLANSITKASRFVFELKNRYLEPDERPAIMELEAEVMLKLCNEYVTKPKPNVNFDELEDPKEDFYRKAQAR